jgi:hypothetical protein
LLGYPNVKLVDNQVQISQGFDLLPGGARLKLFETALRVMVQPALAGERINMVHQTSSPRLPAPIQGKLMLELIT